MRKGTGTTVEKVVAHGRHWTNRKSQQTWRWRQTAGDWVANQREIDEHARVERWSQQHLQQRQ